MNYLYKLTFRTCRQAQRQDSANPAAPRVHAIHLGVTAQFWGQTSRRPLTLHTNRASERRVLHRRPRICMPNLWWPRGVKFNSSYETSTLILHKYKTSTFTQVQNLFQVYTKPISLFVYDLPPAPLFAHAQRPASHTVYYIFS